MMNCRTSLPPPRHHPRKTPTRRPPCGRTERLGCWDTGGKPHQSRMSSPGYRPNFAQDSTNSQTAPTRRRAMPPAGRVRDRHPGPQGQQQPHTSPCQSTPSWHGTTAHSGRSSGASAVAHSLCAAKKRSGYTANVGKPIGLHHTRSDLFFFCKR